MKLVCNTSKTTCGSTPDTTYEELKRRANTQARLDMKIKQEEADRKRKNFDDLRESDMSHIYNFDKIDKMGKLQKGRLRKLLDSNKHSYLTNREWVGKEKHGDYYVAYIKGDNRGRIIPKMFYDVLSFDDSSNSNTTEGNNNENPNSRPNKNITVSGTTETNDKKPTEPPNQDSGKAERSETVENGTNGTTQQNARPNKRDQTKVSDNEQVRHTEPNKESDTNAGERKPDRTTTNPTKRDNKKNHRIGNEDTLFASGNVSRAKLNSRRYL